MTQSINLVARVIGVVAILSIAMAGLSAKPKPKAAKPVAVATLAGNAVRGKALYQSCTGCHSIDENEVGPKHRGVVGRHSAIIPGYAYSPALKQSDIVWTPAVIDRWLTNPQKLVPGAKMFFSVSNPQSRADIIAYLAEQK